MSSNDDDLNQLYRNSSLGKTLQATLDELVQSKKIKKNVKVTALEKFDVAVNEVLEDQAKARLNFEAGQLTGYRFCNNTWTFILEDVEIKEINEVTRTPKVKIVVHGGKIRKNKRR